MAFTDSLTVPVLAPPILAGSKPPAKPLPIWKLMREARDNPFAAFPQAAYEQPILDMSMMGRRTFLINDPAGIKQVLLDRVENYPKTRDEVEALGSLFGNGILTSDGETWRAHRRIMAPAFDPRALQAYAPAMARATEDFLPRWRALPDGATIDIGEEMTQLTLEIISETVFSSDTGRMTDLVGRTFEAAMKKLDFGLLDILPVIGRMRMRGRIKQIHEIFRELDAEVARLIAERAQNRTDGPQDLLSRLVAAQDGESGVRMTPGEVRDQVITIFVAGHETTAVAMTWVWYLLSQHPAAAAKLHAELEAVLGGRTPTQQDLHQLPYTRMVIDEALSPRARPFDAAGGGGRHDRRPGDPQGRHGRGDAVGAAPPHDAVGTAGAVRAGAVFARAQRRTRPVWLYPVRRGTSGLHRHGHGADRGDHHPGDAGPALQAGAATRL